MKDQRHNNDAKDFYCPIGKFFASLEGLSKGCEDARSHFINSKIEFLKAIKSLIDHKIDDLETKKRRPKKRAEKIEIG